MLEKSRFYALEIKKAGRSQSQIDRLRSVFRLIQARNGTLLKAPRDYLLLMMTFVPTGRLL